MEQRIVYPIVYIMIAREYMLLSINGVCYSQSMACVILCAIYNSTSTFSLHATQYNEELVEWAIYHRTSQSPNN